MAFVDATDAQSVGGASDAADDAVNNDEPNLNDGNTGTTASAEIRAGMNSYKIIISLGFAFATLDNSNFSVRVFDGAIMDDGLCDLYPYTDANSVDSGEAVALAIVDDGSYDTVLLPSAFVDALGDLGSDQVAIRLAPSGGRGRFNNIQVEFSGVAVADEPTTVGIIVN